MTLTHIRPDDPGADLTRWSGLCGVEKPGSSISKRMFAAQQRGDVQPFLRPVVICPQCQDHALDAALDAMRETLRTLEQVTPPVITRDGDNYSFKVPGR